jgi:hypothetical protein
MQSTSLVAFFDNTTAEIDPGYDSNRIANIVSIYSQLETGNEELGIQARETFDPEIKIPFGFSTMIDTETYYIISINDIQGEALQNAQVYLFDRLLNTITELTDEDYTFRSGIGDFKRRFTLFFEVEVLDVSEEVMETIFLFPNPAKDVVVLGNPHGQQLEEGLFYDLTGRLVKTVNLNNTGSEVVIDISDLASATYQFVINGRNGRIVKPIIKE